MEIVLLPQNAVKIKSKTTTLLINPSDVSSPHQAALYLTHVTPKQSDESVTIIGPGEYEVGGIKISGVKSQEGTVYSMNVDTIDILVGNLDVVDKLQHKLKEHNIVLIDTESDKDAAFVNGLATNVVMLYGDMAKTVVEKFAKEGLQQVSKFQSTKDKLPQEIQTILLA